jgi:hypothetical protein
MADDHIPDNELPAVRKELADKAVAYETASGGTYTQTTAIIRRATEGMQQMQTTANTTELLAALDANIPKQARDAWIQESEETLSDFIDEAKVIIDERNRIKALLLQEEKRLPDTFILRIFDPKTGNVPAPLNTKKLTWKMLFNKPDGSPPDQSDAVVEGHKDGDDLSLIHLAIPPHAHAMRFEIPNYLFFQTGIPGRLPRPTLPPGQFLEINPLPKVTEPPLLLELTLIHYEPGQEQATQHAAEKLGGLFDKTPEAAVVWHTKADEEALKELLTRIEKLPRLQGDEAKYNKCLEFFRQLQLSYENTPAAALIRDQLKGTKHREAHEMLNYIYTCISPPAGGQT